MRAGPAWAKHDWYRNPITGVLQAVPRHREVNEHLARRILRLMTDPPAGTDSTDGPAT